MNLKRSKMPTKNVITKETDKYVIIEMSGLTRFKGCQCHKDCDCADKFIAQKFKVRYVYPKRGNPARLLCCNDKELEETCKRVEERTSKKINVFNNLKRK